MKIQNKKFVAILSSFAFVATLSRCMPSNNINNEKRETVEEVREESTNVVEIKEEKTDTSIIKEYIDYLKQEFAQLESYSKEKWNSEECIEKRENIKENIKTLSDFIFNGKEINGVTFKELKEDEKEKLLTELESLDSKIDEYIPDYKERFKDWMVDKGADAKEWLVEKSADLKEMWENYKNDVEEEYNNRKLSKKI